jgi:putative restriction endonuclease
MIPGPQGKLLEKLLHLNTWVRAGQRAPHKPLYFLYCLGKLQAGMPRLEPFSNIQGKLKLSLQLFGPTRKSHHAEYPFWHLAHDRDDICEVSSDFPINLRPGSSNPSASELVKKGAKGGFRLPYFNALQDLGFASIATHRILDAHFPPILHSDILDFFEINLEEPHSSDHAQTWEFKKRVLDAYEGTCSITGLQTSFLSFSPGLEPIHIYWPQAGGNDDESNGILMNLFHAKLFTLGLIGISDHYKVLLSPQLKTANEVEPLCIGRSLRLPSDKSHWPSQSGLEWHRTQVFKA